MKGPEFDIVISPAGKVTVTVKGVKGPQCLQYADLIREIVGREEERRYTADYYAPAEQVRIDSHVQRRVGE
jgi:hypothetical protein